MCKAFAECVKGRFNPKTDRPGLSDVTVQSHLAAVSSYYDWLRCRDKTLRNPVAGFKYRRTQARKELPLITEDSVTAMAEASDSEVGNLVIELLGGSGLRLTELVSLKKRKVTIDMGPKDSGRKPCGIARVKGKGGKTRFVLIGARAATALINYQHWRGKDGNPALILSSRKCGISRRTVQRIIQQAAAKVAGHCHPHELRPRFATNAIEGGLPEKQLKKNLGQVNFEHTYRYIHLSDAGIVREFDQAMEAISRRLSCASPGSARQLSVRNRKSA
jgi:site-specific recombinase XerD